MKKPSPKVFVSAAATGILLAGTAMAGPTVVNESGTINLTKPKYPAKTVAAKQKAALKTLTSKSAASVKSNMVHFAKGEVIVKYKKGITAAQVMGLARADGLTVGRSYKTLSMVENQAFAVVKGNMSTEELMKKLKADPNVESVSPNYIRTLNAVPNDPEFRELWGMNNTGQTVNGVTGTPDADIDAPEAWNIATGLSDTVVAVLDTGVDYTHVDLVGNMWHNPGEIPDNNIDDDGNGIVDDVYGADFASDVYGNNDGDPMDIYGHGTHVAGIIGAVGNDGVGITGINWNVSIMSLKVFDPSLGAYTSDILEAIDYILQKKSEGVNIVAVNASYGGYGGDQTDPMNDAIKSLGDAGIVFCAAAGNDANDNDIYPSFPASYDAPNIISVAATDQHDELAWFSNYGATTVDIAAPGVNIYSTLPGGGYIPAPGDLFYDDLESGTHTWYTGGTSNWAFTTEDSFSPVYSLTDSTGVYYTNDTDNYLLSEAVDLSAATGDLVLGFKAKLDIEVYFDTLNVIMSPDGGTNWYAVASFDGEGLPWQSYTVNIPEQYRTSNFRFGFELVTDYSVTYDGVHIDDVGIGISTGSDNYAYWMGTSMATPSVTGAVALLSSTYPAETAAELRDRILLRANKFSSLSGKVSSGGRLNLNNAIQPEWNTNTGSSSGGGGGGGGGLPVYDKLSLLLTILGFLAIGGLIARRRLA